jgi:TonB family protein
VAPTYPLESRRLREEGTVVLNLLLGTSGRVEEIAVSASSGSPRLDKAALEGAQVALGAGDARRRGSDGARHGEDSLRHPALSGAHGDRNSELFSREEVREMRAALEGAAWADGRLTAVTAPRG